MTRCVRGGRRSNWAARLWDREELRADWLRISAWRNMSQVSGQFRRAAVSRWGQAPVRLYSDYGLDFPYVLSPPWSGLAAYDLNTGTILWNVPTGC